MEEDDRSDEGGGGDGRPESSVLRQSCCDLEHNNITSGVIRSYSRNNGHNHHQNHHHHHYTSSSSVRNIEIDWREVDPYFSELSDCASFWTLINFTCDVIYSGLFVLFFIMGQDVESMFFEGLLNHINPILIYLILSLVINYGALRSLRCGREKCFLTFSIMKGLLFPITLSLLMYLVFCDVQDYFGSFWVSFVVIVGSYNLTTILCLWSMFTCNKYILVNEAAQKRMRKYAKEQQQQQQRSVNNDSECRCNPGRAATRPVDSTSLSSSINYNYCEHNQITPASRPGTMTHSRNKVRDSNSAYPILPNERGGGGGCSSKCNNAVCSFSSVYPENNQFQHSKVFHSECGPSRVAIMKNSRKTCSRGANGNEEVGEDHSVLSFDDEEDEDVLQISTIHKVMQEIRLLDAKRDPSQRNISDDADSLA